jgi:hypothetical protein
MLKFNLPTAVTVVLGVLAGALEYLNAQTFAFPPVWHQAVQYGILLIGLLGVTPLVGASIGAAVRNLVHMSSGLFTTICVAVYALTAAVTTLGITGVGKGIILGVVAFLATIGFGPNAIPGLPVGPPTPAPVVDPVPPAPPAPAA